MTDSKRKKKKKGIIKKKTKILDVIESDELNKTVNLYFDITVCTKYSDIKNGFGLKIINIDITNKFGQQLVDKANIKNDSEWIITKCDKKNISNNKTTSIIVNYIRQQFRKNGQYQLKLCFYKKKSFKQQQQHPNKSMFSMTDIANMIICGYLKSNHCWKNEYNLSPILGIIAYFCAMKANISQFKWYEISNISNTANSVMIMKCKKINKTILVKSFKINAPKKSFPNIFIALKNNQTKNLQICKFGNIDIDDLKKIFVSSKKGELRVTNSYRYKWNQQSKNNFVYMYHERITDSTDTMFGTIDQGERHYMTINLKKLIFSCYSQGFCENSGA